MISSSTRLAVVNALRSPVSVQSTPVSTTGANAITIVVVNSSQLAHPSRAASPPLFIPAFAARVLAANPFASVVVLVWLAGW